MNYNFDALLPRTRTHEIDSLIDDSRQVGNPARRRRQPGEVEEALHGLLQPANRTMDDLQIVQCERLAI